MTTPVAISLNKLFCYHGADEGISEPYLWVIGFTLDGRTITHAPDSPTLTGTPGYFFSPGSHGNLGGGVGIGANRLIPREVGRFATTLDPIVLHIGGRTFDVPGQIGLIGVLLEENSTSDAGAESAHQAINELIQTEVNEAVADINLAGLAAEIHQRVAAGAAPEDAIHGLFAQRIDRLVARIQRYAEPVAVRAIVSSLSGISAVIEGIDPDEFMGVCVHFYNEQTLGPTTHESRIEFTDTLAQPGVAHLESSDYVYNIHGEAWQRIMYEFTPITDQVPPGRWQITGINFGSARGGRFISHVGGGFPDGSPWQMTKEKVMDLIRVGSHTFFVRGSSGVDAEVIIQPNPVNQYFPSITTAPDSDPSNNLGDLPLCPISIRHVKPVD